MSSKSNLRVVASDGRPRHVNATMPVRMANADVRTREYLEPKEVEKLIAAAKKSGKTEAQARRNATMILIAYRHGLRASEIADLQWSQVTLGRNAVLHITRAKNGTPSVHPLQGDEQRALRELRRDWPDSDFVFCTERGGPFTPAAINRTIQRIGERAGMPFQVHAHMLRHACGYALANAGQDTRAIQAWLGHKSIQHTVRYSELSPTRFKSFWRA